eukprot:jgi/Bigna1/71347/fgenesh1_pg.15_\
MSQIPVYPDLGTVESRRVQICFPPKGQPAQPHIPNFRQFSMLETSIGTASWCFQPKSFTLSRQQRRNQHYDRRIRECAGQKPLRRAFRVSGGMEVDPEPHKIHRCRFFKWKPGAITCLAFTEDGTRIAVGRENGDIEIWREWHCELVIPGYGDKGSVYRVLWLPRMVHLMNGPLLTRTYQKPAYADDRMIPMGLSGFVTAFANNNSGAIWSCETNGDRTDVALGCEDGTARIYSRVEGSDAPLVYKGVIGSQKGCAATAAIEEEVDEEDESTLTPFEALRLPVAESIFDSSQYVSACRILSLCYGKRRVASSPTTEEVLAICVSQPYYTAYSHKNTSLPHWGSNRGRISLWSTKTGELRVDMQADKFGRDPTWVWCLKFVLHGQYIAVGDSLGKVTLWDLSFGTQTAVFSDHIADVLALAVEANQSVFYSAGADGSIAQFRMVQQQQLPSHHHQHQDQGEAGARGVWVRTHTRRVHSHDVRALAISPKMMKERSSSGTYGKKKPSTMMTTAKQSKRGVGEWLVAGGVDTCLSVAEASSFGKYLFSRKLLPEIGLHSFSTALRNTSGANGSALRSPASPAPPSSSAKDGKEGGRFVTAKMRRKARKIHLAAGHKKLFEFSSNTGRLSDAQISPCGKWVAISDTSSARLYSLSNKDSTDKMFADDIDEDNNVRFVLSRVDVKRRRAAFPSSSSSSSSSGEASSSGMRPFSRAVFLPGNPGIDGCQWLVTAALGGKGGIDVHNLSSLRTVATCVPPPPLSSSAAGGNKNGGVANNLPLSSSSSSAVRFLEATQDGKWVGAVDSNGVCLYSLADPSEPRFHGRLPGIDGRMNEDVAVAFSSNEIMMFKIRTQTFACVCCFDRSQEQNAWSQDNAGKIPYKLLQHPDKIIQIIFDWNRHSLMLLVTSSAICVVDLIKPVSEIAYKPRKKRRARRRSTKGGGGRVRHDGGNDEEEEEEGDDGKEDTGSNQNNKRKRSRSGKDSGSEVVANGGVSGGSSNFKMLKRYQPLRYVGLSKSNQLIMVETPWMDVAESLPPPVYRHKYGT